MKVKNQNLKKRPPIVVVLGHIDHGKTTLLDNIRKSKIAEKEAGLITQSVGSYEVEYNEKKITFIDTPGHRDFKKMRESGLETADIAILIIAVDEGVKEQTKEIISFLNEKKMNFVVALNKIDKPNAQVEKTISQLIENGVLLEKYGGNTPWQKISAKTGEGVNELLDLILLMAEMAELNYNPSLPGEGFVLEVEKTKKRGIEASVVLENGFLKTGLYIKTPSASGKIKILENFLGKKEKIIYPSSPARIIGFKNPPISGEKFVCSEKPFEGKAEKEEKNKKINAVSESENSVILKAKDIGSLSALKESLKSYPLNVVSSSIGEISLNDLRFAKETKSLILGFKTRIDRSALNFLKTNPLEIISSEIIYKIIEDLEERLKEKSEKAVGELRILALFGKDKGNQIVGGEVISGEICNGEKFKIERNNRIIGEGNLLSLESEKKKVEKIFGSQQAGLLVSSNAIIKTGDKLIFYQ